MARINNCGGNQGVTDGVLLGFGLAMDVFDKLPKTLRVALANADHNWSGEQLYRARKRKHPAVHKLSDALAFLQQQDKAQHDADADAGLIMGGQR